MKVLDGEDRFEAIILRDLDEDVGLLDEIDDEWMEESFMYKNG